MSATPQNLQSIDYVEEKNSGLESLFPPKKFSYQNFDHDLAIAKPLTSQGLQDIESELKQAKTKSQVLANVRGELLSIIKRPQFSPGSLNEQAASAKGKHEDLVLWDQWYFDFAKICEPRLLAEFNARHNPAGANSVQITVRDNLSLSVNLISGEDDAFSRAAIQAYSSLSKNPALKFPQGSLRQQVTFSVENRHDQADSISGISTKTCTGDIERKF